jgi:hypothetical protein
MSASPEREASRARARPKQDEIKKLLADTRQQIGNLKLFMSFSDPEHESQHFQSASSKLLEMESVENQLTKKLQSLEKNQQRQRRLRERKKFGTELMCGTNEPPNASINFLSSSSAASNHMLVPNTSQIVVSSSPITSSSTSPSIFRIQRPQLERIITRPGISIDKMDNQQVISKPAAIFPTYGVWENMLLQQVTAQEMMFLNLIQLLVENHCDNEFLLQVLEVRKTFLQDSSLFGKDKAVTFLLLQIEQGIILSKEQKQYFFTTTPS